MNDAILRRGLDRVNRTPLAGRLKRLRARTSPAGRAEARRTRLPFRYRGFRMATIGPVGPPIDHLAVRDILADGRPAPLPYDTAVVAGEADLTPEVVDALIECERTSTPTLLLATAPEHLESELAAVCTDIATADRGIYTAASAKAGVERIHRLPDDPTDVRGWLSALISLR